MFIDIFIFAAGLFFLVKGADYFVEAAASIAKKLGVSELIIGLTLVALGTSIPELASSVVASIKGHTGLIIGNVVGSNIANIGLIVGVAATIAVIMTNRQMLNRDGYIMIFASILFYIAILNGVVSAWEAAIFLLLYIAYMIFLLEVTPETKDQFHFASFIRYFFRFGYIMTIKSKLLAGKQKADIPDPQQKEVKRLFRAGLFKDFVLLTVSGITVVFGAKYLVDGAIFFARTLNLPDTIVGISIVALGTSLPELSVSITAARKGYGNIAVGNVIGSNIANIFLVLGVTGLIVPLKVIEKTITFNAPFMLLMSVLLLLFIRSRWTIRRVEGAAFLVLYTAFMFMVF